MSLHRQAEIARWTNLLTSADPQSRQLPNEHDLVLSRDPRANSRFRRGQDAAAAGALAEAAEMMEQALALAPQWAGAWAALGGVLHAQSEDAKAATAFATALRIDPADTHGAALALARLSGTLLSEASAAYVTALFDAYATRYEAHLTGPLGYTGPAALVAALHEAGHGAPGHTLDLGCGTGLCGEALRRTGATHLAGVDLSPAMIAVARDKRVGAGAPLYDRLVVDPLQTFLDGETSASADTIAAADVFSYLGDLAPALAAAARVLRPGGVLAFTVQRAIGPWATEQAEAGEGYAVGADLRFAHAPGYVRAALAAAGLGMRVLEERSIRRENGAPVPGLVVAATAPQR